MKKAMLAPNRRPLWKEDGPASQDMDAVMERLHALTGASNRLELADLLGVRASELASACRRGAPRASWLMTLMLDYGVSPRWVLTGEGTPFLPGAEESAGPEAAAALRAALAGAALVRRMFLVECSGAEIRPGGRSIGLPSMPLLLTDGDPDPLG